MKKKIAIIFLLSFVIFISSSCTRDDAADSDDLFGPSSLHYIVEGSATPSILWVNGSTRPSTVVKAVVTDYQRKPLANQKVYFQQMGSSNGSYLLAEYGYFENDGRAMYKRTDANGVVQVTFYGPLVMGSQTEFFIKAMVQDIDQTYTDGPCDYIKIQLVFDYE